MSSFHCQCGNHRAQCHRTIFKRSGFQGAIETDEAELGFVGILDRVIVEAPGDGTAEALLFHGFQNHEIDFGLIVFRACRVVELRGQFGARAVLRIVGGTHAELAHDKRAFSLVQALAVDDLAAPLGAEMGGLLSDAVFVVLQDSGQADL